MSYFNLYSQVTIDTQKGRVILLGDYPTEAGAIESITIDESVKDMGDKCNIVVPRNIKTFKGEKLTDLISEGNRVYVSLGYDGLVDEFEGYIKEIGGSSPISLELDDNFYPLRKNSITQSYQAVSLKQLLTDLAPGYEIHCPDVNVGKKVIDRATSYQVLKEINDEFGFYTYLRGGKLYCQWAYDVRGFGQEHTYYLCDQVINGKRIYCANVRPGGNNLKYEHASSMDIAVEVCANRANGKKFTYRVGAKYKDAAVKRMNFGTGISDDQAKQIAEQTYAALRYDGYKGTITGYGIPRTKAGDSLNIIDYDLPERNGKYLIEKVSIKYSKNGIERENKLSFKI